MVSELILQWIIGFLIFLTAFPVGLLLAWLCEDELKKDKKYFYMISFFLIISGLTIFFVLDNYAVILSVIYMVLLFSVLIFKSR